jgi:CRP-like cAMP-binding protein
VLAGVKQYKCLSRLMGSSCYHPVVWQREVAGSTSWDKLVEALSKPTLGRTPRDIDRIFDAVKGNGFFEKYPRHKQRQLCSIVSMLELPQGDVVFNQGDVGDIFYVILKGFVEVRVRSDKPPHMSLAGGAPTSDRDGTALGLRTVPCALNCTAPGCTALTGTALHCTAVNVLKAGDYFGELALMSDSGTRSASIVCKGKCNFLTVRIHSPNRTLCQQAIVAPALRLAAAAMRSFLGSAVRTPSSRPPTVVSHSAAQTAHGPRRSALWTSRTVGRSADDGQHDTWRTPCKHDTWCTYGT